MIQVDEDVLMQRKSPSDKEGRGDMDSRHPKKDVHGVASRITSKARQSSAHGGDRKFKAADRKAKVAAVDDGYRKRKRETEADVEEGRHCVASSSRNPLGVSDFVGGRTFPGELSRYIIAGYENPRVFPCLSEAKPAASTTSKSKRKVFAPSNSQCAAVLSKCLPKHVATAFVDHFLRHQKLSATASLSIGEGIPPGAKISKTVLAASIHLALVDIFGDCNVVVECCDKIKDVANRMQGKEEPYALEVVVLDAVLARSRAHAKPLCHTRVTVDKPVKLHVDDDELLDSAHDERFRALIALIPDAGVFYCHRERRKACVGVHNSLVPLDMNWLRTLEKGNSVKTFGAGGYVSRLWQGDDCARIWKWKIKRGAPAFEIPGALIESTKAPPNFRFGYSRPTKAVYHLQQCADEDAPRLPPDFIHGKDCSSTMSCNELRRAYLMDYAKSPSARRGCRHYVRGYLHRNIDPASVFIIDAENDGDVDLHVSCHIRHYKGKDAVALFRDSIVQVRHLPALGDGAVQLLRTIHEHAWRVRRTRGSRGVRANQGDNGSMHPIGTRIMKDRAGPWRSRYVASSSAEEQPYLAASVGAVAQLAAVSVPGVLRVMQDMEEDANVRPSGGMLGNGGYACLTNTADVSVDLENASHYDANDASQSLSVFTEDIPGSTKNWYFVLPNVYGKRSGTGKVYNGVAIKLTHGTMISWDGRLIRHCTSMSDRAPGCHVYGTFFGAKTSVVHYGVQQSIAEERQRLAYAATASGSEPIVDMVPSTASNVQSSESRVIIETGSVQFEGSVCSLESDSDGWIAGLGGDLPLGDNHHNDDDDSTVDDGVPNTEALASDEISDSGIWDEGAVITARRIPARQSSPMVGNLQETDELFKYSSPGKTMNEVSLSSTFDRRVPDLVSLGNEIWSCVACQCLCIDSGETSSRDALRFLSSGGSFRATVDARETRHPNQLSLTTRQRLQPFCPFLGGAMVVERISVRVYYPYFRLVDGNIPALYDVLHPKNVTAYHLMRASRVLVPCPHLQFHFEEFWKVLLPEFTTLRTGIEWIEDVAWYYIQMVRCKTKYPHILSRGPAFDTWVHVNDFDWDVYRKAVAENVMVGVSGDCERDNRLVAVQSLTPGTYLGGKGFTSHLCRCAKSS